MRKIIQEKWICDFCGKDNDEVEAMIAGPNGHAICGSCTEIAMQIVIDKRKKDEGEK